MENSQAHSDNLHKLMSTMQGIRKRSKIKILGLPLYDIALGPDFAEGTNRGHARGIVAIGDIASGIISIGGISNGCLLAIGGCSFGSIAIGGFAVGGLAIGGAAVGIIAMGGAALGLCAIGGGAFGEHVLSGPRQDQEMVELARRYIPWFK